MALAMPNVAYGPILLQKSIEAAAEQ